MPRTSWLLSLAVMASLAVGAAVLGTAESPTGTAARGPGAGAYPMIPAPTPAPSTAISPAPTTTTTTAVAPTTTTTAPSATTAPVLPGVSRTQVLTYDPYKATGALAATVVVTEQVAGSDCYSNGVAGQGSYRCFTTSQPVNVDDPCFAAPGASTGPVVCPTGGPGPDVIEVAVSTLPPVAPGGPAQRPWVVELSNGQICKAVNAAWGGLGPYACLATTPGPLADCHLPEQGTPTWSDACQSKLTTAVPFVTYPVQTVWY